jgi:putative hydrolase of the HAD superfamily
VTAQAHDVPAIAAVTVGLDNTLFPLASWLDGAWDDVATAAGAFGIDSAEFLDLLRMIAAAGSDGRTIERALVAVGVSDVELPAVVPGLVAAFNAHAPAHLDCYPGVEAALTALRSMVPVACVTEGDPHAQRSKLRALRLSDSFDAVVFSGESDEPGGALERAASLLGVPAAQTVHVTRSATLIDVAARIAGLP